MAWYNENSVSKSDPSPIIFIEYFLKHNTNDVIKNNHPPPPPHSHPHPHPRIIVLVTLLYLNSFFSFLKPGCIFIIRRMNGYGNFILYNDNQLPKVMHSTSDDRSAAECDVYICCHMDFMRWMCLLQLLDRSFMHDWPGSGAACCCGAWAHWASLMSAPCSQVFVTLVKFHVLTPVLILDTFF